MVVVSLAGTGITDDDVKRFTDFPHAQMVDLSDTQVGDDSLSYIAQIPALEELIVVDTRITDRAMDQFRASHPAVKVVSRREQIGGINPFQAKAR